MLLHVFACVLRAFACVGMVSHVVACCCMCLQVVACCCVLFGGVFSVLHVAAVWLHSVCILFACSLHVSGMLLLHVVACVCMSVYVAVCVGMYLHVVA